jgi:hypothetical protein
MYRVRQHTREHARYEARICMGRVALDGITTYHSVEDPLGENCGHCATARTEALARCALTHDPATVYVDGMGVRRYPCCLRREDGKED